MAKIAFIADTHYGVRNDSPVFYDYFKKSLDFFYDILKQQNIKHVIHLGDLFDRRKYLNFHTAKRCREDFLETISDLVDETHIIAGNHDIYFKNTHIVNCLDEVVGNRYPNIKIYTNPQIINIDGLDIQLLPWIMESNEEEAFKAIAESKAEILIGHLEINGFELLKSIISEHGYEPSMFSRYDSVFSGHYHHKSSINNIHYIGAFAEYTWSDYNDPRGFSIFDTETRKVEFYKNPHSIFNMILYDDKRDTELHKKDYSHLKDTYVKVVTVNKDPYLFDLFIDTLYKVSPIDITIIEDVNNFTDTEESMNIDEAEDTPTILNHYIENLTLPVNNDKMKDFMRQIYNEAISIESM